MINALWLIAIIPVCILIGYAFAGLLIHRD